MTERILTLRALNRTFLARQLLIERQAMPIEEAVERLLGLQSQIPNPPYIGLWTRLHNFKRDDLTQLMESRQIVRAAMMRSTLHLVSAGDHHRFRPVIQPAIERALRSFFGKRGRSLDIEKLVAAARPFLLEDYRTTGDLRACLLEVEPDADADAMAYLIRTYLPLVQVPPGGTWGAGSMAAYAIAEDWLGEFNQTADLRTLFFRYLEACGPASIMDFQTWTGMTKLKDEIEALRPELITYQTEDGKELFDLPDMTIQPEDTPVPVRFIPEYDNLLISHADRNRIIADADRKKVFLSAARVLNTFLVDGFVAGTWKITSKKNTITLTISPFKPIESTIQDALIEEGERLCRFVDETAGQIDIQFEV
ncbi:MAG: winged helix DNA-binding domain-containing protein [Aggregatilineales bacterium]